MSLNWGKLYSEGRCREVGISWTEEEVKELYVTKTATVDEIRARYYPAQIAELEEAMEEVGMEVEEVEEVVESDGDAQDELSALKQEATDMGIKFHPNIGLEKLKEKIEEANS